MQGRKRQPSTTSTPRIAELPIPIEELPKSWTEEKYGYFQIDNTPAHDADSLTTAATLPKDSFAKTCHLLLGSCSISGYCYP